METFKIDTGYSSYEDCYLNIGSYHWRDNTFIRVDDKYEGPISDISINLNEKLYLEKHQFFIPNYKNADIIEALEQKGLIKPVMQSGIILMINQGYGTFTLYEITPLIYLFSLDNPVKKEALNSLKESQFNKLENLYEFKNEEFDKEEFEQYWADALIGKESTVYKKMKDDLDFYENASIENLEKLDPNFEEDRD